jgi:hypothetical protein
MAPPMPAVAVTVCVLKAKDTVTVQSAVIAPVVYIVPASEPLHPVTETTW